MDAQGPRYPEHGLERGSMDSLWDSSLGSLDSLPHGKEDGCRKVTAGSSKRGGPGQEPWWAGSKGSNGRDWDEEKGYGSGPWSSLSVSVCVLGRWVAVMTHRR